MRVPDLRPPPETEAAGRARTAVWGTVPTNLAGARVQAWRADAVAAPARGDGGGAMFRWLGRVATLLVVAAIAGILLLAFGPVVLPFRSYAVVTGSMQPAIPAGALVFVTPTAPSQLKVGDVITFAPPGRGGQLVTHRIFAIQQADGKRVILTKGDANPAADAWELQPTPTSWRYVFFVPTLGYVWGGSQSYLIRLALILVAALALGLHQLHQGLDSVRRRRPPVATT